METKLINFTVAPELQGYRDICTAMQLFKESVNYMDNAMQLYQKIAEINKRKNFAAVERGIRHAKQYFNDVSLIGLPTMRFLCTLYFKYVKDKM